MSFPADIRVAAMLCVDPVKKHQLIETARSVEDALKSLSDLPTHDNLKTLNGFWAYAVRTMHDCQKAEASA